MMKMKDFTMNFKGVALRFRRFLKGIRLELKVEIEVD